VWLSSNAILGTVVWKKDFLAGFQVADWHLVVCKPIASRVSYSSDHRYVQLSDDTADSHSSNLV
jgi:hypothetical protein